MEFPNGEFVPLTRLCEGVLDRLSERDSDALTLAALASDEALRRKGHDVDSYALQSVRTATSLRTHDGKVVVTGTPEQVASCKASHTGSFLKAHLRP